MPSGGELGQGTACLHQWGEKWLCSGSYSWVAMLHPATRCHYSTRFLRAEGTSRMRSQIILTSPPDKSYSTLLIREPPPCGNRLLLTVPPALTRLGTEGSSLFSGCSGEMPGRKKLGLCLNQVGLLLQGLKGKIRTLCGTLQGREVQGAGSGRKGARTTTQG